MVPAWQGLGGWRGGAGGVVVLLLAVYVPVIMQRQFPAILCPRFCSSTVAGYSCSETGTHSANCAADRRDSSGAALGRVLDMPVVQRVAQFACRGRRHLRRGADADPYRPSFQKNIEILQLQYIGKVIDIWVCRSCSSSVLSLMRQSSSHNCSRRALDQVVDMPVVVQRQLPWFRRQKTAQVPQLQYFFVVDVPVVQVHLGVQSWTRSLTCPLLSTTGFYTVEVPQIQFIACLCGHSSCATQTGTTFPAFFVMAAMSGFSTHFASFFALLRLSRS